MKLLACIAVIMCVFQSVAFAADCDANKSSSDCLQASCSWCTSGAVGDSCVSNADAAALPAAVLIASFVGTGSSFLAFANLAQKRGLQAQDYPQKGIYYLGGLTEGTETICVFVAMCLWPSAFPTLALGFAAACLFTTVTRWHMGWKTFATSKK